MLPYIPPTDEEMIAAGYWLDEHGNWVDAETHARTMVATMLKWLRCVLEGDVPF